MESKAYFAGGCFWCITPPFYELEGVKSVASGFSGGKEENPTYEDVKRQLTGHRETICITYDPEKVGFKKLLDTYLENIDPFDGGGQFIDRGKSYTLAIYYTTEEEAALATQAVHELAEKTGKTPQIVVEPMDCFYMAEEYHQDWYRKNPQAFKCEMVSSGRRALVFDTLPNTRDLGGLKGIGGRCIIPGRLIRSGNLSKLEGKDLSTLSDLVETVIDMRTTGEREAMPDVVIPNCEYINIPIVDQLAPGITHEVKSSKDLVAALMFKPKESKNYISGLYRQFVAGDFPIAQYRKFIDVLLSPHKRAVLWHCTVGKDRVGTSTVILLRLLGVSESDILDDYMQTNANIKGEMENTIRYVKYKSGSDSPLIDQSLAYLFGTDPQYIHAFDQAINLRFGSFSNFISNGLKLTSSDIQKLRDTYLMASH